jgi:hypothetical protein
MAGDDQVSEAGGGGEFEGWADVTFSVTAPVRVLPLPSETAAWTKYIPSSDGVQFSSGALDAMHPGGIPVYR